MNNLPSIFYIISYPIQFAVNLFNALLNATGLYWFVMGMLIIALISVCIILPIRGGGYHLNVTSAISNSIRDRSDPHPVNRFYADSSSVNYYGQHFYVR